MLTIAHALVLASSIGFAPPSGSGPRADSKFCKVFYVEFQDRGLFGFDVQEALDNLENAAPKRQIERRRLRRQSPGLFDARDLPVNQEYVNAVLATGAELRTTSRWLNAISVNATPEQLARIGQLECVTGIKPVRRGTRRSMVDESPNRSDVATRGFDFYGGAAGQTDQVNLRALHDLGFTGAGVVIGVLDTGFERSHAAFNYPGHPTNVIAEWDFINNDGNTGIQSGDHPDQHVHGTLILSVLGAYKPGDLVGAAYDASFVLAKTEVYESETQIEEDYYVAGLEFIEMQGADIATSSLGYIDWYSQSDLDGETAVTTVAVNIATENGMHCCTAMGNGGYDGDPSTSHFIAPADAFQVISCGAAYVTGQSAEFSSDGPTADGRLKPEVMARGVDTACVWPYDTVNYATASGTSLSTPVVAGVVACLTGARPSWSVDRMRSYLTLTASDFVNNGTTDPLFVRGYGIVNALSAYTNGCPTDFNGDMFVTGDDFDLYVAAFELGDNTADFNGDGFVTGDDFDAFVTAFEMGC